MTNTRAAQLDCAGVPLWGGVAVTVVLTCLPIVMATLAVQAAGMALSIGGREQQRCQREESCGTEHRSPVMDSAWHVCIQLYALIVADDVFS